MSLFDSLQPDPMAMALGTGMSRFKSPHGIEGLAKDAWGRLDILAVQAQEPGCGQLRSFIDAAKKERVTICVWLVDNPILKGALERYGFFQTKERMAGDMVEGMRWDRI